jgi:hypothetical protein
MLSIECSPSQTLRRRQLQVASCDPTASASAPSGGGGAATAGLRPPWAQVPPSPTNNLSQRLADGLKRLRDQVEGVVLGKPGGQDRGGELDYTTSSYTSSGCSSGAATPGGSLPHPHSPEPQAAGTAAGGAQQQQPQPQQQQQQQQQPRKRRTQRRRQRQGQPQQPCVYLLEADRTTFERLALVPCCVPDHIPDSYHSVLSQLLAQTWGVEQVVGMQQQRGQQSQQPQEAGGAPRQGQGQSTGGLRQQQQQGGQQPVQEVQLVSPRAQA